LYGQSARIREVRRVYGREPVSQTSKPESDEMNPEYDICGGVRGKYYKRYQQGTNVVLLEPGRSKLGTVGPAMSGPSYT
jgi:hypothetical protein